MKEATSRPIYGVPTRSNSTPRNTKGRTCEAPGCVTILSTYNASPTCWLHSAPATKHALATK